jgi:hypothetical protein
MSSLGSSFGFILFVDLESIDSARSGSVEEALISTSRVLVSVGDRFACSPRMANSRRLDRGAGVALVADLIGGVYAPRVAFVGRM